MANIYHETCETSNCTWVIQNNNNNNNNNINIYRKRDYSF